MLRSIKTGMLALSIMYILIGLLLLTMPAAALLWICYAFGAVALLTGVTCLVRYAQLRGNGFMAPFMLICGVVTAGLGVFILLKPETVASFLPLVFGLFILVDGVSRVVSSIELARRHGQKWWVLLLFGILSVALGILLMWRPFDIAVGATMLCGIMLVAEGVMNLGCTLYASMELRALERMAESALNATLAAAGDALDEVDEATEAAKSTEPVVYEAASTDVSDVTDAGSDKSESK